KGLRHHRLNFSIRTFSSNPTATLLEHASLTQGFMGTSKSAFPRRLRPQNRDSTWANLGNALKCRCRVNQHKDLLKLAPTAKDVEEYQIPSFHPLVRVNHAGSIRWDLAVEIVQSAKVRPDRDAPFRMRGGTTLIISTHSTASGAVVNDMFPRFVITK